MPTQIRCLLLLAGLLCAALGPDLKGQESPVRKAGELTRKYFGSTACVQCHRKGVELPDPNPVCRGTEVPIWESKDKHRVAFDVLKEDRARRMGELLKIDPTKHKSCLVCHAVYLEDSELMKKSTDESFRPEEGVSCVACHGAYQEWVEQHGSPFRFREWRKKTREQKERESGMQDLWSPARRTQVCASCHIGNSAEEKVVTHEMYAAGHPPLPSFEIGTFSEAMPRHWELMREKKKQVQELLQFDGTPLEQTRQTVESGVAGFGEAMRLLAAEARNCSAGPTPKSLDYAHFDCASCHHDLKSPSWRQKRGYQGAPGRPPMASWPIALVRLGIRHAAGTDEAIYRQQTAEFDTALKKLLSAFASRPYGDCQQIAGAANSLVAYSDRLLKEMSKHSYTQEDALRLLSELCTTPSMVDFDSARQIVWAFRIIHGELPRQPEQGAKIQALLKSLDEQLHLHFAAGQKDLLKEQPKSLESMANYDPTVFQARLAELCKLVVGGGP